VKPALAILAGGASRRLGECKALVDWNGVSSLERMLAAAATFDDGPLVVTGFDHERIRARAPRRLEVLHNANWSAGRLGSLRVARDARPGRDLCVAPVDAPLVSAAVFDALYAQWTELGAPALGWLAPRTDVEPARFGHPVVIGRKLLQKLEALGPDGSLRTLRSLAHPLSSVACDDVAILDDLDTPEDLSLLRRREFGPH